MYQRTSQFAIFSRSDQAGSARCSLTPEGLNKIDGSKRTFFVSVTPGKQH
jgi:hypothetical protein